MKIIRKSVILEVIVLLQSEQLHGGGGNGCSDDEDRKLFYELVCADSTSCHVQCGATSATSGGNLPSSLEPLSPPPYVARSYSVMSPGATSFVEPNVVAAGNMQAMNAYNVQRQQQQQYLLSPFSAGAHGLFSTGAGAHLVAEPLPSALPASSRYSDAMAPTIRAVGDGHWYPPATDSRFSSKLLSLVRHNTVCVYEIKVVQRRVYGTDKET